MTRFAVKTTTKPQAAPTAHVPVKPLIKTVSKAAPDARTYEGADGWLRKPKSELFLLAVTNMVGQDTFYESGAARDSRFIQLIHEVAAKDPKWVASFVPYLRDTLHLRTASIVMALEYIKSGAPNGRTVLASALQRAEEPSEALAYWMAEYGKRLPKPVKRGVADAVQRMYTEKAVIKWDAEGLDPRFGDVIEMTHAKGVAPWQDSLFRYAMAKRHNRPDLDRDTELLPVISAYRRLMAVPVGERRAMLDKAIESGDYSAFEGAGLTWENLSGWLQGPMDAAAWQLVIPQMQYMATLRNLRNFEEAGISAEARDAVIKKLTDPNEVKESKQLPIRFYTAYRHVKSLTYASALEQALDLTLANIPALSGRTLVLVDVSSSMHSPISAPPRKGKGGSDFTPPTRAEAAAIFGAAAALRAEKATLVAFNEGSREVSFHKGGSILRTVEAIGPASGSTNTWQAMSRHYDGHDRTIIITDEQAHPGTRPETAAPLYIFNVAGYERGMAPSGGNVYTFGGFSDAGFAAIEAIESHTGQTWPWETAK